MFENIQARLRNAAHRRRRDVRGRVLLVTILAIAILGYGVSKVPGRGISGDQSVQAAKTFGAEFAELAPSTRGVPDNEFVSSPPSRQLIENSPTGRILDRARDKVRSGQFDQALLTLNDAHRLLHDNAEAFMLIGQALEGKKDYETARDFYNASLNRDPWLSDAHWGFATSSEALGDLESALAGMRSYLHTEKDPDPARLRINQARSAIWEWEAKLGRGPWGPSRGVPPGFVSEDLKRDSRGVGIKWPLTDTLQADGNMQSEVRTARKVKIYPRP